MSTDLPPKLLRLRANWHADLATVAEALDRLDVPSPPEMTKHQDRIYPDGDPAPSLVWRLAWLEGHVAQLRAEVRTAPAERGWISVEALLNQDERTVEDKP